MTSWHIHKDTIDCLDQFKTDLKSGVFSTSQLGYLFRIKLRTFLNRIQNQFFEKILSTFDCGELIFF